MKLVFRVILLSFSFLVFVATFFTLLGFRSRDDWTIELQRQESCDCRKESLIQNNGMVANATDSQLDLCPLVPPGLVGPLKMKVLEQNHTMKNVEKKHPELDPGGAWRPNNCIARHRVAILVPYRDRQRHLVAFLEHMHPFLQKQQLDYDIYVIEQTDNAPFNRGMLLNIGFVEASRRYDYQCYVLHDVDLLPENDMNLYSCPTNPRHMCVARSVTGYKLRYKQYFGGVSSLRKEQFEKVNGFSNLYFGWGGEDDDFYRRVVTLHEYELERPEPEIGRYTMLEHVEAKHSPVRRQKLRTWEDRAETDGLNNLKYELIENNNRTLYTRLLVNFKQSLEEKISIEDFFKYAWEDFLDLRKQRRSKMSPDN